MTEVLYYLSNLTNTPNIFTNSTKARSKRFDTWFHRQVKSSQVPCASGCDGRELFLEKAFLSRLTKLVPGWPTFSLFRSLHTFAHRSLFSSLERARDKTSCHLVIGGEQGAKGRMGEDNDAIRLKICEDEVCSLNIEMLIIWWDRKKAFFIANIKCVSTILYWHFYCRSSFFRVSPGLRPICPIL